MTKRMLIDATHSEETRVVVLDGNRLEDFDVETAAKAQLKGNIYLAKIVRVEPSLQAAFVEYGGGRHGFLAFGEIHPDYYQIPVADRQRLLELQEAEARAEEEAEDAAAEAAEAAGANPLEGVVGRSPLPLEEATEPANLASAIGQEFVYGSEEAVETVTPFADNIVGESPTGLEDDANPSTSEDVEPTFAAATEATEVTSVEHASDSDLKSQFAPSTPETVEQATDQADATSRESDDEPTDARGLDRHEPRAPARFMRSYKIQEVIRRRQILLVQVVKEERGTKGAALTTFVSLAGRFCVLMPNSPRGGGISRKITSGADRRRLKEVTAELQIPRGMGLIVRTAGAARPKAEIKRDCEYLLELWDSIRETTMASIAPALIHEEANLIRRAIRDNYSRDVDEVLVDGELGWRAARDFMRMLMPAHARKVILWGEPQPLFARQGVEAQLDSMLQPTVQLRSGGYLVINQTEALVAIDVNSGRSTRERGIEETALKTNLEAADEVARQLRLRDLAGLIVIDFIDMESRRNNALVEKRMKDALRDDRARIQLGSISHFGLMELSRQRLRPSLTETSFTTCPHCAGSGLVRTTETAALAVLRAVEEEGAKRRAATIVVHVAGSVALYVLNNKRTRLAEIEARYGMGVSFAADESLLPPQTRIERTRPQLIDALPAPAAVPTAMQTPVEDDLVIEEADEHEDAVEEAERTDESEADAPADETAEEGEARRRKRRRRRRGGRREDMPVAAPAANGHDPASADQPELETDEPSGEPAFQEASPSIKAEAADDEDGKSRRRGRRGGRRRRREPADGEEMPTETSNEPSTFDPVTAVTYTGPTPADPFGGQAFDIFDMMDEPDELAPSPTPAPASPEPPPEAVPDRPVAEGEAAEATVPAEADTTAGLANKGGAAESMDLSAEPHELALAAVPAALEQEPPLPNGHSPSAGPTPSEPVSSPVAPPLLVGSESPAEKKRGWWRR